MHEYDTFEDTKKEIIAMGKRFMDAEAPVAAPNQVPEEEEGDDDDEDMSGFERLLKRRRLSGDLSVRSSSTTLSEVEIEMQNYEALPVSVGHMFCHSPS